MSLDLKAVYAKDGGETTRVVAEMMGRQSKAWGEPCSFCGGHIGPDITNRPMCYGCGPVEMIPAGVLTDDERARRKAAEEWP
jgi:hypothetical protein